MGSRSHQGRGPGADIDTFPTSSAQAPALRQPTLQATDITHSDPVSENSSSLVAAQAGLNSSSAASTMNEVTTAMAPMAIAGNTIDILPDGQAASGSHGNRGGWGARRQRKGRIAKGGTQRVAPIWHHAMRQLRLIEIEWRPSHNEDNIRRGDHYRHRVSPRSRVFPSILHVNQESCSEAKLAYRIQTFDTITSGRKFFPTERCMYFNRGCDILFFDKGTCVTTLLQVLSWGVVGGVTTMQALHGFDAALSAIVRSMESWRGEINDKCILVPTESYGMTLEQATFKQRLLSGMALVESGQGLAGVGTNIWVGDDKPTFSFANIRPLTIGTDPKVYDALIISRVDIGGADA
ncbi:uncharacterized protein PAC_05786 [Phialocephala subalpina]|uniref:2EXR domain-containing protein n=1 Tax=Phialocephala subalpina TaxID=576137 RepID=A0A1L7WSZ3_9HELO|nr:uncharacterized protein PAC_05786 [Phialocephala subalpina]